MTKNARKIKGECKKSRDEGRVDVNRKMMRDLKKPQEYSMTPLLFFIFFIYETYFLL